ncbi:MAG: hypothetical protein BroJett040_23150 [Oligoflexia bacterium]|nr:MAG: hypothetical protein BroJett040_23150 [Oligoflexia bacterium]
MGAFWKGSANGGGAGGGSATGVERSLRYREVNSAYLSRDPSVDGNRRTFTISAWLKRSSIAAGQTIYCAGTSGTNNYTYLGFLSTGAIRILHRTTTNIFLLDSADLYRDPSSWYHVHLSVDTTHGTTASRVKLYVNGELVAISGTNCPQNTDTYVNTSGVTQRICRWTNQTEYFDGYITEYYLVDGQALDPSSFGQTNSTTGQWVPKSYTGTYGNNGFYLNFRDESSLLALSGDCKSGSFSHNLTGIGTNIGNVTPYPIANAFNGKTSKSYVVDAPYVAGSGLTYVYLGKDWGSGVTKTITGFRVFPANDYFGYNTAGGSAMTLKLQGSTDNFSSSIVDLYTDSSVTASTTNIVTVTSGIVTTTAYRYHRIVLYENSPYGGSHSVLCSEVEFYEAGSYAIGNNWQTNGISNTAGVTYDVMYDYPANGTSGTQPVGNYAVFNPLDKAPSFPATLSNGNLTCTSGGAYSSVYISSGKWVCEFSPSVAGVDQYIFGIGQQGANIATGAGNYTCYRSGGNKEINGSGSAYGASWAVGNTVRCEYNADGNSLEFFVNNVSQGTISSVTPGPVVFVIYCGNTGKAGDINFGQRPFVNSPTAGFRALCTANLPDPVIKKPNQHFDVITRSGVASGTYTQTGIAFAPDFVWVKSRNGAYNHNLFDVVRGVGKSLRSDGTIAEQTNDNNGYLSAFTSDGYTLTNGSTSGLLVKDSSYTYVDWLWKAGGTAVANNSGSISSQVSANVNAGFSVVTYTGSRSSDPGPSAVPTTIGHGLNAKPAMVITRALSGGTIYWNVWHQSAQSGDALQGYQLWLHLTNGRNLSGWQRADTGMTSTTFCPARYNYDDILGVNYVAYCFAEVSGFSMFGSYTGNGSADGPFVWCGFRPKYVMVKRIDSAGGWFVLDTVRGTYNPLGNSGVSTSPLNAENTNNEAALAGSYAQDFLANGFKLRDNTAPSYNASGGTYIFIAFAEAPFKYARAR